jgi:hypothetical protein
MEAWQVWLNIFKWYNLTRGALNHLFQLKAFWDDFVQAKSLSVIFQSWESKLKKLHQFWLKTSPNCSSLEDDFKQLVSWNPLFRYTKLTFWRHQITDRYLSWPCQFQLAVSWNWPGPSKSSSVIPLFLVSHILEWLGRVEVEWNTAVLHLKRFAKS